tara:strand:+ start:1214 stop:1861 length:648 start_codon:yes stop_codon:yes gene_type:complete
MKKITAIIFSLLFFNNVAFAEGPTFGVSLMAGQASTDGSESEDSRSQAASDVNSKSITEQFMGASVFFEVVGANGGALGIDWVPLDIELGSGSRTDTAVAATAGGNENDTGTRTASADIENLITLYANIPTGYSDVYALLGIHHAEITTSETLKTSTYGNEDVFGGQIGLGKRSGNLKYEVSYSDFENISLASSNGSSTVSADADALTFKVSYGF